MRPIDADNLISVLDILSDKGGDIKYWEQLKQIVADCPTIDAAEVRRGRWIESENENEKYVCSVCGGACWYYDYEGDVAKSNFCPNCGADMREAKNGCDDCFVPLFYNLEDDDSICRDCGVGE